jgi:hypothetical protein
LTPASRAIVSAAVGGSEVSENTALTLVALILATRSALSRPDSSAEVSKLGMTGPTSWRP